MTLVQIGTSQRVKHPQRALVWHTAWYRKLCFPQRGGGLTCGDRVQWSTGQVCSAKFWPQGSVWPASFSYFASAVKGLQGMSEVQEAVLCEGRHTDPISYSASPPCKLRGFAHVRSFLSILVSLCSKTRADQIFVCGQGGLALSHMVSLWFPQDCGFHKTGILSQFTSEQMETKWWKDLFKVTGRVWNSSLTRVQWSTLHCYALILYLEGQLQGVKKIMDVKVLGTFCGTVPHPHQP